MDFEHNKFMETDNEKPLWTFAAKAWEKPDGTFAGWDVVTQAVIAEHERRKAEQVKPEPFAAEKAAFAEGKTIQYYSQSCSEWLDCNPSPPSWYPDFEYRVKPEAFAAEKAAFAAGKTIQCYSQSGLEWRDCNPPGWFPELLYRVKPEPFAAEKAAFAEGKMIQYYSQSCSEWLDCDPPPPSWFPDYKYRAKPETVMVELGPDDVPPGSLHFCDTNGYLWLSIIAVTDKGICTTHGFTDFGSLFRCNTHKINRQDGLGWVPCSKIKQE